MINLRVIPAPGPGCKSLILVTSPELGVRYGVLFPSRLFPSTYDTDYEWMRLRGALVTEGNNEGK